MDEVILGDLESIARSNQKLYEKIGGSSFLVTGCAGFLGAHFLELLTYWNEKNPQNPCEIYALDTYISGVPKRIAHLLGNPHLRVLKQDATAPLPAANFDYIIHCAGIASPMFYRKYPIETMDANVASTRNMLDYAAANKIKSMLFFSSSEVYGDPDAAHIPTKEEYRGSVSCTGPRACYDESKRYGETMCVNFWKSKGVPVKMARPFNVYGPGMRIDDRRVLPDFFRDAFEGRDIALLSDGKATRSFTYVSDAIDGFMRVLFSDFNGEAFNVGNDREEISMLQLANEVCALFGNKISVTFKTSDDKNYLTDNPSRRCPDLTKIKTMLGYEPKVMIKEGLKKMKSWYERNR